MVNPALPQQQTQPNNEGLPSLEPTELDSSLLPPDPTPFLPRKAKQRIPKAFRSDEKRNKLALRICEAIEAGINQRGGLLKRWIRNEAYYENKHVRPSRVPWDGAQSFHIPLASPRLRTRKASLTHTLTSNRPYFRLKKIGSQDRVEPVELGLQLALDSVGFESTLDLSNQQLMITNYGLIRVSFQEHPDGLEGATHTGAFAGVVFDVIPPEFFVRYPSNSLPLDKCRLVGHCYETTQVDVKNQQKLGVYLPDPKVQGGDLNLRKRDDDLTQSDSGGSDPEDQNVVLWDVIWRDDADGDGKAERYRCIVHPTTRQLLYIEEFSMPFPPYACMTINKEVANAWTEGSPAQDVQALQILMNTLVNEFIWGTQMRSRPMMMMQGGSLGESIVNYKPGEIRRVRDLGNVAPAPANFDPTGYKELVELTQDTADSASKTSDTLTGAPASPSTTATEQNIKFAGFQLGGSDDVMQVAPGFRHLGVLTLMLLIENFDKWYQCYSEPLEAMGLNDVHLLKQRMVVEVANLSPEDAPQLQGQQAEMLIQLIEQIPDTGIPLAELLKTIIQSTSLSNKEDLIRAIDQHSEQMGMIANAQQFIQMLGGGQQPQAGGQPQLGQGQPAASAPGAGTGGINPALLQLLGPLLAHMGGGANPQVGPGGGGPGYTQFDRSIPPA